MPEIVTTFINVIKACMGGGIYGYPELFQHYGVFITVGMTILSGMASMIGAFIYINLNQYLGKGQTISTLSTHIFFDKFRYIVDITVIIKCMLVATTYLNLAKEQLKSYEYFKYSKDGILSSPKLPIITVCALSLPFIASAKLDKIRFFSYAGTLGIFFIIIASAAHLKNNETHYELYTENRNILKKIGSFVFGFSCHQSILSIHNESKFSLFKLKIIMIFSFLAVGIFYLFFGYINYSKLSSKSHLIVLSSIFEHWNDGYYKSIAILVFAFVLLSSVPFQLHPAKTYFIDMFKLKPAYQTLVASAMLIICYLLAQMSFYNFSAANNLFIKPFNTLLCFGYPSSFYMFFKSKKSLLDYFLIGFLAVFSLMCIVSYAF